MRKTITPVVSIVLLVLMTVGAAVLAFVWIGNVQANVQEAAGSSITGMPGSSCSRFSIISTRGDGITVSNVGCDTVGNISVLIDGELTDYDLSNPLAPGSAVTIPFSSLQEGEDHCVTIVLANGQEVTECVYDCSFEEGCSGYVFTIEEIIVT